MDKQSRIDIQDDTLDYVRKNKEMRYNTFFEKFKEILNVPGHSPDNKNAQIFVVKMDTLNAVIHFQEIYKKRFCALVMANAFNKGGGYLRGASAQEESVCRRTNLPRAFQLIRYPLPEFGGIYCSAMYIIKDVESTNCEYLEEQHRCDAILIAAYSRPPLNDLGQIRDDFAEKTKKKMRSLFNKCIEKEMYNVVLGALGCGAFQNPPEHIVQLFKEVIFDEGYNKKMDNIVFAIIDNQYTNNYETFASAFE
jgi:uncharacterized protein (TIGR02452 family)